ncbi:MAG: zf-HC2 domain-containing protein [Candidatus Binatia bacterium]
MSMDCEVVKRSLGAWLDGEMSHSEAGEIRGHLQECPLCLGEKTQLERLQTSLKSFLERRASKVDFDPFWHGVRERILEKRPWHVRLLDWARPALYPQRLAWAIPVVIVLLLGSLSLERFFPEGASANNLTRVESIDSHGFNVALFRESETKTTVIWLFESQEEEDESSGEPSPSKPSF